MGFSSKRGWLEESEVGSFLSSKGYNALKSIAMVTFSLSEQRVDLFLLCKFLEVNLVKVWCGLKTGLLRVPCASVNPQFIAGCQHYCVDNPTLPPPASSDPGE